MALTAKEKEKLGKLKAVLSHTDASEALMFPGGATAPSFVNALLYALYLDLKERRDDLAARDKQ